MAEVVPTALAVLAAGLMLGAVLAMSQQQYFLAGLSFLAASFVIYYREQGLS